ncbi:type II secretion system minor pseudopilin GspJ [Novosphingopyxis sp.]|uniref:type II secretion system minor pseudopilin GspJ n=1 Tax=Novosphingopyxis sp. TaxID=2709690 RepID=UPI003B5A36C6
MRRSGLSCGDRANGFTLIELLVALFIFALLSAAGLTLLRTSTTGQEVLAGRLDQLGIVNRTSGALSADLLQAMPRMSRNDIGDPLPAFDAGGTAVPGELFAFTRAGWSNYDQTPRSSLQRVAYSLENGELRRNGWPMLDGSKAGVPATLMRGVKTVKIRYRAYDGSWREDWTPTDPAEIPRAVELLIQPEGLAEFRLSLMVGPQGRADPNRHQLDYTPENPADFFR